MRTFFAEFIVNLSGLVLCQRVADAKFVAGRSGQLVEDVAVKCAQQAERTVVAGTFAVAAARLARRSAGQ